MATEDVMIVSMSDELIMAFADGELEPEVAARVREALDQNDAVRQKHAMYVTTRSILAQSFDAILDDPIPERLKTAIRSSRRRVD